MAHRALLPLLCAACAHPTGGLADPADVVAVPLTAASASLALQQTTHVDLAPPWSLTASDGTGLALTRVEARAVFQAPLAFTELHLYFHNPETRRREGTFAIALPAHAAVSRFAMENDGQWMEAEVVEKQLARRAYDDFLHRRQDPALLEKAEGNQFTAKVFPIAPNSDKHIVISYSQVLPGARYVLPLRGLPKIESVGVEVAVMDAVGKRTTQQFAARDWEPDRDFTANAPNVMPALAAGTLVAAQIVIGDRAAAVDGTAPRAITMLVDTSASRGLGYEGYVHSIHTLIAKLRERYGAGLELDVIAFDQDTQRVFSGRAEAWGDAEDKQLVERGAAGASDLGQALASLRDRGRSRVVIVTDGMITAGIEHGELAAVVKHLAHVDRLDVVLAGGLRDDQAATELVRAGLPHAGAVLDLETGAEAVAAALEEPVQLDVPIAVAGATWVYPRTIASVRAGTSVMVYARFDRPAQTIDVTAGNAHQRLAVVAVAAGAAPLVERAFAGAEIDALEATLVAATPEARALVRKELVATSVAARVLSSETSMLVLETDADYARYGIDRKSVADVLVVGSTGVERTHRQPAQIVIASNQQAEPAVHDSDQPAFKKQGGKAPAADGASPMMDKRPIEAPKASPPPSPLPPPAQRPAPEPVLDPTPAPAASASVDALAPHVAASIEWGHASNPRERDVWPPKDAPVALTGDLAAIEHALAAHEIDRALGLARDWHAKEPGNVLALVGLGDALEAKGSAATAARVYGSIIDLFPGRADMRRFAAERLVRLAAARTQGLVIDSLHRAVVDRPDHLTGHRLYAYALLRAGRPADAFAAVLDAIDQPYRNDSYAGGERTLADDAGMIGAAYAAAVPVERARIVAELAKRTLKLATAPSTRFILYWETDANDVDFHIQDARGGHAFYKQKALASGGELYADITTGYGPECFAIPGVPSAGPYHLSLNYYSQGPMGYGMGLLEVETFDGKGRMTFDDRPYVIMNDHAYVDLGTWGR